MSKLELIAVLVAIMTIQNVVIVLMIANPLYWLPLFIIFWLLAAAFWYFCIKGLRGDL